LRRLASPVKVAVTGEVAIAPMISRAPVPELPTIQHIGRFAKPPDADAKVHAQSPAPA
jgi:hypothetical protein